MSLGEDHAQDDRWADAARVAALLAIDPGLGGVVVRARSGPEREAWLEQFRRLLEPGAAWRRLPPGAGDAALVGGLDLAATLGGQGRRMQAGLLVQSDGGVLLAPMAERIGPGVAAQLASALDAGRVTVERDGLSGSHEARFVLVALDEGAEPDEACPARLAESLAFHLSLDLIGHREATGIAATPDDIAEARRCLAEAGPVSDPMVEALCAAGLALGVASPRAMRFALRTARALAAMEGRTELEADDLSGAVRLVLAPRATRLPQTEPEVETAQDTQAAQDRPDSDGTEQDNTPDRQLDDILLEAAVAALPDGLEGLWKQGRGKRRASDRASRGGAKIKQAVRGRRIGVRAGMPRQPSALDVVETMKAAAPWQRMRRAETGADGARLLLRRDDLRVRRYEQRSDATVIMVVDASGSAALQRLAETKGAVELLLAEAYVRRTQVALIAFRGQTAEALLPPTRSLARARRCLADLAGGGATPLALALEAAGALALGERSRGREPRLVILSDGRGNIALDGAAFRTRAETDAINAARRIGASAIRGIFIDTAARSRGDGARLAEAMGAKFAVLPRVEAGRLKAIVQAIEFA
jgi:magnesium chelatase subunit D